MPFGNDDILYRKVIEQQRRLGGYDYLSIPGSKLDEFSQNGYSLRMKAQFRLIYDITLAY